MSSSGKGVAVIAGPCSVESEEHCSRSPDQWPKEKAVLLRGGAPKPRTSLYSFQGLGEDGLEMLARARAETGLGVVSEVVAPEDIVLMNRYVDMLQVGSRNMPTRLLSAVGEQPARVLLKRGLMSTIEEMLLAAEYIVGAGNPRGGAVRAWNPFLRTATRGTLDISAVPVLKERSHLPVIVDPSHAAGSASWFRASLAAAGVAAGADGLLIEVHDRPDRR